MISVLCTHAKSNYKSIPGLDLWPDPRNAYNFSGDNPVIAHPPCAQWSRMKNFARINKEEKDLAVFCWEKVLQNGGIFEHPAGSSFFNYVAADRKNMLSVNQSWWGFPCTKRTYLYFHRCSAIAVPLSFDCVTKTVNQLHSSKRSIMPLSFCTYLVSCIDQTFLTNTLPVNVANHVL